MTDIYDQHEKAFANVAAYVILDSKREKVATVAIKFPNDGAGRLYAYVHWIGAQMVRGFAAGGGYDKRSAACADAMSKVRFEDIGRIPTPFLEALSKDSGFSWDRELEKAGYMVLSAV